MPGPGAARRGEGVGGGSAGCAGCKEGVVREEGAGRAEGVGFGRTGTAATDVPVAAGFVAAGGEADLRASVRCFT